MKTAISALVILLLALSASAQVFTSSANRNNTFLTEGLFGTTPTGQPPSINPADNWIVATQAAMLASPKLADLNGDGAQEILMTTYDIVNPYWGGYLHAWDGFGFELTGYPIHLTGAPPGTPAVGDLDNDGDMEIVQGTWQNLYVLNANGTPYPGWPLGMYITQTAALADVDNNGDLEIIVPVSNEMRVYHHTGVLMMALPISAPMDLTAAAVGDLEGDGTLEIVTATFVASGSPNGSILAWHANGQLVNGFPVNVAGSVKSPPALADVDNDGQMEIIAGIWNLSGVDLLYLIQFNGTIKQGWPIEAAYSRLSSPTVGDLNGDGDLEIVVGGWSTAPSGEKMYAFHHTGMPVTGFPVVLPNTPSGNINSSCVIGNLDSDPLPEIVVKVVNNIYALNHDGTILAGFPYWLNDEDHTGTTSPTPAIGNMDDDDQAEIFAAACFNSVMLIDQPGGYDPSLGYWPSFRRDPSNQAALPSSNLPNLDVMLIPPAGQSPFVIPAGGGVLNFTAAACNHGPQAGPFTVWARMRNPDGTYSLPTIGPLSINLPFNTWVSRLRSQNIPGSYAAGIYLYIGYASWGVFPVDSSYFAFAKGASSDGGLWITDASCSGEPFPGEIGGTRSVVSDFSLIGAYPNPFNPTTTINYELRAASHVNLKIYDTSGRLVITLADGWRESGKYEMTFDGSKLVSGIYLYQMNVSGSGTTPITRSGKLALLK
jgi:hypothetical protein